MDEQQKMMTLEAVDAVLAFIEQLKEIGEKYKENPDSFVLRVMGSIASAHFLSLLHGYFPEEEG